MSEPWLVVHGRFQPFHLGHLEYLSIAIGRAGMVVVGVTNPDIAKIATEGTSDHRHLAAANPFTYFERAEMVIQSMADQNGADGVEFRLVPFDVSAPATWSNYLPRHAEHLVTVNEEWDAEKVRRFRAAGFRVQTIKGNDKRVTGSEVRRRIGLGEQTWRDLVPAGTARVIDSGDLTKRIATEREENLR